MSSELPPTNESGRPDARALFADGREIDAALAKAVRDALLQHKRAGNPIAIWREGQVVWIPPEEIEVDEPAATDDGASPHDRAG